MTIYQEIAAPTPHPDLRGTMPDRRRYGEALPYDGEDRRVFDRRLSRDAHHAYFVARYAAGEIDKADGEALADMQAQTRVWADDVLGINTETTFDVNDYRNHDMAEVRRKIGGLADYVAEAFGDRVSDVELEATRLFLTSTEAMYETTPKDGSVHPDADGSFAFVVPARMSRKNTEYGQEVETVIPILRYLPRELRASMMVGLPPFVIDTYKPDQDGKRGYLVLAPVYPDMQEDLERRDLLFSGQDLVNEAVDFAYGRLGASIVGLGATLPAITKYGQTIKNPNVITTTGHGGTVHLILETMNRAIAEERISAEQARKIGILGLGSIGASIASVMHDTHPDAEIIIFDTDARKVSNVLKEVTDAYVAEDGRELIERAGITVSALPDIRINPRDLGMPANALEGKLIIDDSQPAAFDPEQVAAYGGLLAWVVGHDGDSIVRTDYNYGNTLATSNDLFGCEAEAATLSAMYADLIRSGVQVEAARTWVSEVAIRSAVTPESVRKIGELFTRYTVTAAPLQAFGSYI